MFNALRSYIHKAVILRTVIFKGTINKLIMLQKRKLKKLFVFISIAYIYIQQYIIYQQYNIIYLQIKIFCYYL